MSDQLPQEYVLGIDLGSNSLGWAIIGLIDDEPAQLVRTGVRVFEAGVNVDPKSGREKTLNAQRREALQQRRQLWRHRRRLVKVAHILQRAGLLPPGDDLSDPNGRQGSFNNLDARILASPWFLAMHPVCTIPKKERTEEQRLEVHRLKQLLPYLLRAAAVEGKVEDPHFIGRALYHLAQRRGFWSNRKTKPKKDEKPGEVERGIKTLRSEMGDKTLGQHFASLSPLERRIRDQWTSRDMYQAEFKTIWDLQAQYHPAMRTEGLRQEVFSAIFDQRPLRLKGGLVGRCEFEPGERRAPAYLLISQRFRLLQVVNNLKYRVRGGDWKSLSPEERQKLIHALERCSSMEFKDVRECLGLSRSDTINLQRDKEEARMPGNDTAAQLIDVFGEAWHNLSPEEEQRKIVASADSILGTRDFDERRKRAEKYLAKRGVENLERTCEAFLNIKFEAGYRSLSVKAMERFMPLLEHGFQYGALSPHYRYLHEISDKLIHLVEAGVSHDAACERLLNRKPEPVTPFDALPPVLSDEVQKRIGTIRNPIVIRSLTETRKVVNAIIEKFRKPNRIHIELLRELKKPKVERERIWKENLGRDNRNRTFEEKVKGLAPHLDRVRPKDIEKYRLWEESKHCPYCLKPMTPRLMFGEDSEYQIDHIIPFGLSLDDSFVNKVLCHTECNRRKGHRTPFQAFSENPDAYNYQDMLRYVKSFHTDKETREEKLRRFKMHGKTLEEFFARRPAQQFNDSAYASRLAADYLALLYGGRTDAHGNLRVQARSGGLTKYFREAWNLNSILGDGDSKNGGKVLKPRHDHRHHAIDAAVIAATDQDMVRRLNDAAKRRQLYDPKRFSDFPAPPRWPGFRSELKNEVTRESRERVQVSHRVSKKVSGALHKDTNYSAKDPADGYRRLRVPITELTVKDLKRDEGTMNGQEEPIIVDKGVRQRVLKKWQALGAGKPEKVFSTNENHPFFEARGGRRIPIRNVRIRSKIKTFEVGRAPNLRYVKTDSNHHVEVFEINEKRGRYKWRGVIVDMREAYRRKGAHVPIVNPESREGFLFSLSPGDTIKCRHGEHAGKLLVLRGMRADEKRLLLVPLNDARKKSDIEESGDYLTPSVGTLQGWDVCKVIVSPIGEVSEAKN